MTNVIQISNPSGTTPFNVYVCDVTNTYCYFAITFTGGTITFNSPSPLEDATPILIKIIDANNCETFQYYQCPPTQTPTPTITPTPSSTPTDLCYCLMAINSGSLNGSFDYIDCNGTTQTNIPVPSGVTYYACGWAPTNLVNVNVGIGNLCSLGGCIPPLPSMSATPTQTPTQTPTPTPTPTPIVGVYFLIGRQFDESNYYVYDIPSNSQVGPITLPGFVQDGSLANTIDKFWINPTIGDIVEWDVSFSPFVATYNRSIVNNETYTVKEGLEAIDNTTLIATLYVPIDDETYVYEVDIATSTANYTQITQLTGGLSGDTPISDISLSTTGDIIVLGGLSNKFIQQYVYSANSICDVEIDITTSIPNASGIVGYNNQIYITDSNNTLYNVDVNPPYTVTIFTDPMTGSFEQITQTNGSVTTSFS